LQANFDSPHRGFAVDVKMEERYEYDAPQFYDFYRSDEGDSMASKWFDCRQGDAGDGGKRRFTPVSHPLLLLNGRALSAGIRSPLSEMRIRDDQATSQVQMPGQGTKLPGEKCGTLAWTRHLCRDYAWPAAAFLPLPPCACP
jgi:hypothetical protein